MGRLFIEPVEEFNRSHSRLWFVVAEHKKGAALREALGEREAGPYKDA
jgi:hypothetical protein